MKTVAVIPAYNEAKTIAEIIGGSFKYADVVVVSDDWSKDATRKMTESTSAFYCRNDKGRKGAGGNTAHGIKIAEQLAKADVVVTIDGDGQHNPAEMLFLLEPIRRGEADIVIGSRFLYPLNGNMPKYRAFGIKIVNWLVNLFATVKFTDTLCCFRAFTREAVKELPIEDNGFGFGVEMLIKARKLGLRVKEMPVTSIYHDEFWQNHTMWPLQHGLSLVFATIKWRIKCAS